MSLNSYNERFGWLTHGKKFVSRDEKKLANITLGNAQYTLMLLDDDIIVERICIPSGVNSFWDPKKYNWASLPTTQHLLFIHHHHKMNMIDHFYIFRKIKTFNMNYFFKAHCKTKSNSKILRFVNFSLQNFISCSQIFFSRDRYFFYHFQQILTSYDMLYNGLVVTQRIYQYQTLKLQTKI